MNKRILKIFAVILAAAMLLSTQILSASAAIRPLYRGDVDNDGGVDIDDVTLLQEYIAGLEDLSKRQIYAAEVDGDDKLTVDDVTMIQKYCAGMIKEFNTPDEYEHTVSIKNFYSDYSSGRAPVGTPVTFYAEGTGGIEPFTYEFYVNNILVREREESNNFTYTFDETGFYNVYVRIYNVFDEYVSYKESFEVIDDYSSEQPVISSIYLNMLRIQTADSKVVLTANAIFGTEPYEYQFSLDNGAYVQEFSENNSFDLEPYLLETCEEPWHYLEVGKHTIQVSVRDSSGQITTEDFEFEVINNLT